MQVETFFKITRFPQMEYGGVMVARLVSGPMIHAIKAFFAGEDGDKSDFLVSIGPFGDNTPDQPAIYVPRALRDQPVVDVSRHYRFVPSFDPTDLSTLNEHSWEDLLGRAVLMEEGIYLGAAYMQNGGGWVVLFLNVTSGEILRDLPDVRAMVTRRWRIIASIENAAPTMIFEHQAQ